MQKITNFLLFEGKAEEAMNFYVSLFDDSSVEQISRYGAGQPGRKGTVIHATFILKGQEFMCIDSYVEHGFSFTAAMSFYVRCDSESEVGKLFDALSAGGTILMPLGAYPFSKKYGWVNDRYGVSWQLSYN